MGQLIGVKQMFSRGLEILTARIIQAGAVRIVATVIALATEAWFARRLVDSLRVMLPQEMPVSTSNLTEILQSLPQTLPPEALMDLIMSPALWLTAIINIVVLLWAQGALYLALFPNPKMSSNAEPRSLGSVAVGALGLMFPLVLVNIFYSVVVFVGTILLIVPGIWLAIKYSFAPLLLAVEDHSAFTAFGRSNELVKGRWWGVFFRLGVIGLTAGAGFIILRFIPTAGTILFSIAFPPFLVSCQLAIWESLKESQAGASGAEARAG
ncbi:MAG: hypothetical protein AAB091_04380 [Elusimicrobiota bacterium]